MSGDQNRGNVHDPRVLRAIAHPLRNRILTELTATGPMRAADLARELGVPANQASFHLRQLAKYGLIEEAPEAARDQRDRVWKAAVEEGISVDIGAMGEQPGGEAAARVFMRSAASFAHHVVDAAYSDERQPGQHRSTMESAIRLTREEAGELSREITALIHDWSERTRGRADGRATYLFHGMLLPHPDIPVASTEEDD